MSVASLASPLSFNLQNDHFAMPPSSLRANGLDFHFLPPTSMMLLLLAVGPLDLSLAPVCTDDIVLLTSSFDPLDLVMISFSSVADRNPAGADAISVGEFGWRYFGFRWPVDEFACDPIAFPAIFFLRFLFFG